MQDSISRAGRAQWRLFGLWATSLLLLVVVGISTTKEISDNGRQLKAQRTLSASQQATISRLQVLSDSQDGTIRELRRLVRCVEGWGNATTRRNRVVGTLNGERLSIYAKQIGALVDLLVDAIHKSPHIKDEAAAFPHVIAALQHQLAVIVHRQAQHPLPPAPSLSCGIK